MSNGDWRRAYDVACEMFGKDQVTMKIIPNGESEATKPTEGNGKMKFKAGSTGDFKKVPAGNHVGICNAVIDLGLQKGSERYPKPKHQVYIRFELPTETIEYEKDGEEVTGPMSIGRMFTASMHENANLRAFIESWFSKRFPSDAEAEDFEFAKLAGYKCLLNVTHNESGGKTYANISNATPIPKGMKADYSQHNPSMVYDLEEPDEDVFAMLPEWLQNKINGRIQYEDHDNDFDDDLPPVEAYEDIIVPF